MKKFIRERFDEIIELADEINSHYLIYYFKGKTAWKKFDDFNGAIKSFEKEAKNLQNVFKSNLNKTLTGGYKSEEQKSALKVLNCFTNHKKLSLNLYHDYSSIAYEANYKVIHGKGHPDILARMSRLAKVSDHSYLKILTPKQMLQRLAIALKQEKAGNTFENLLNKVRQMVYFLYRAKEII